MNMQLVAQFVLSSVTILTHMIVAFQDFASLLIPIRAIVRLITTTPAVVLGTGFDVITIPFSIAIHGAKILFASMMNLLFGDGFTALGTRRPIFASFFDSIAPSPSATAFLGASEIIVFSPGDKWLITDSASLRYEAALRAVDSSSHATAKFGMATSTNFGGLTARHCISPV